MSAKTESLGYALLIGVDDYAIYDASVQAPPEATRSLRGSVNDVRAWYRLCRELGYPAENIRVLTSPEIPRPELGGATVGPATDSAIREGVAWLAGKLGAPARPAGVLTFSGHGSMSDEGLLLCPANVKADGDVLQNAVNLLEIQALIEAQNAQRNLTVAMDCCHGGDAVDDGKRPATALRPRPLAEGRPIVVPSIGDRMFLASEIGASAYQAEFSGGRWHGAFTWAFMTVKDQWTIVERSSGHNELTISYADMRKRAEALLAALSFDQRPALRCQSSAAGLPVFHRGLVTAEDATSRAPDAERRQIQLDPGHKDYRLYTIGYQTTVGSYQIGYVVVPNTTSTVGGTTYNPGAEYWYLNENVPTTSATKLHFTWRDLTWGTAPPVGALSFTMTQAATWSSTTAPASSGSLYVLNGQMEVCINWGLTHSGTSWSSGWGGTLTWYTTSGQNTVFGGTTATEAYLSSNTTPSTTWFAATAGPTS